MGDMAFAVGGRPGAAAKFHFFFYLNFIFLFFSQQISHDPLPLVSVENTVIFSRVDGMLTNCTRYENLSNRGQAHRDMGASLAVGAWAAVNSFRPFIFA